jgi:ferredoxin
MADDEKPLNRRSFFRDGIFELLRPLSKPIERKLAPFERISEEFRRLEEGDRPKPAPAQPSYDYRPSVSLPVLRPPGALAEQKFTETCSRCGNCVSVCPANAIRIDEIGYNGGGFPYIDAEIQACVVCDSLACMRGCPTEALGYVPKWLIDMGTAEWHPESCTRPHGDTCTVCIDHCPMGAEAIELRDNDIFVKEQGCIGCGLCQYYCPTYPKSIVVIPKAQKEADKAKS